MRKEINLASLKVIGRGKQATVYEFTDEHDQKMAMKVYKDSKGPSRNEEISITHLRQLADSTGLLIPTLKQITLTGGHSVTVLMMPLCSHTLEEELKQLNIARAKSGHDPETVKKILVIFSACIKILITLSKVEIMHGDLKPDNMLISAPGSEPQLSDFGVAQHFEAFKKNRSATAGSELYKAPELTLPDCKYPLQSMMWSMAMILRRTLGAEALFKSTQPGAAGRAEMFIAKYEAYCRAISTPPSPLSFTDMLNELSGTTDPLIPIQIAIREMQNINPLNRPTPATLFSLQIVIQLMLNKAIASPPATRPQASPLHSTINTKGSKTKRLQASSTAAATGVNTYNKDDTGPSTSTDNVKCDTDAEELNKILNLQVREEGPKMTVDCSGDQVTFSAYSDKLHRTLKTTCQHIEFFEPSEPQHQHIDPVQPEPPPLPRWELPAKRYR